MSIRAKEAECYSLNIKCPLQDHILNTWFPAGGAVSELAESLGETFEGCTQPLTPSLIFASLSGFVKL